MVVYCVEDEKIFRSVNDASNYYDISTSMIYKAISRLRGSCVGKTFIRLPEIRCLETGEEFMSFADAGREFLCDPETIRACCERRQSKARGIWSFEFIKYYDYFPRQIERDVY